MIPTCRQIDELEELLESSVAIPAIERGEDVEVGPATEVPVEARRLDEPRHLVQRVDFPWDAGTSEQLDAAPVRPDQAEQHSHERRLAGAVRAEQPVHIAGRDGQIHAVDRNEVSVTLRQAPRLQDWPFRRGAHGAATYGASVKNR